MDIFHLRSAGGVELATDGRSVVSRIETRKRGLLVVGRALRKEREADDRAGRQHRLLRRDELHALQALADAEIRGGRS